MKKFLPNLLIFFSVCLCVLIAVQWVREARLRQSIEHLNQTVYDRDQSIQGLQGSVKKDEAEINRLDARNVELKEVGKSNSVEIAELKKTLRKTESEHETAKQQIEQYKLAVEKQNESIKKQNEDIVEQNRLLKQLGEERNDFVKKFNESVLKYNELVTNYNGLVKQVEKMQAAPEPSKEKK